jgi:predicted O-linked N-acetylglucosamine transferase (SPINDLY family)
MLDPFPYSGTTTSCKSLDNSIPIVSKYHKDYHSHNVTASLLINCGFPELVAYSNAEYIDIVKKLSEDPDKLDEYKTTIKPKFKELMNPVVFMKQYENLIRQTLA